MKRFEERAKAWPGAEFAAAIDAGMDEPSIVTMLTKVMNVGVAGVSKRAEKIDNELDKFRDAMVEKREALRTKKKASAVNKADRKAELASNRVLKEFGIKLKTADLPIQERKIYLAGLNTISQIEGKKFNNAAEMVKVLTDVFEETTSGGGTPIKTAGGLSLTDAKESAKVFNNLNLVPVGASRDKSIRAMASEARKILNENPINFTNKEKAARAEMSILERPENIKRLEAAAKKAAPNITFKARTVMRQNTDPSNASSALINRGVSNIANMGQ